MALYKVDKPYEVDSLGLFLYINDSGVTKSHLCRMCGFTGQTFYNKAYNKTSRGFSLSEEEILKRELKMSDEDFARIFRAKKIAKDGNYNQEMLKRFLEANADRLNNNGNI